MTARIELMTERGGRKVFVGTFEELPGVVCEGATEAEVTQELSRALGSIRERLGWPVVVMKTEHFSGWSWTGADSQGGGRISFGERPQEQLQGEAHFDEPRVAYG